jgi:hypothetical protein
MYLWSGLAMHLERLVALLSLLTMIGLPEVPAAESWNINWCAGRQGTAQRPQYNRATSRVNGIRAFEHTAKSCMLEGSPPL